METPNLIYLSFFESRSHGFAGARMTLKSSLFSTSLKELIVLHKDDSPATTGIRKFLTQLQQTELLGVVVILSVRYDYRIFLERFAVPLLKLGKNWQDVPAFTFADSMLFIKDSKSGLDIAPTRLKQILTEAACSAATSLSWVKAVSMPQTISPRSSLPVLYGVICRKFIKASGCKKGQ
jgi:hypothetical protein